MKQRTVHQTRMLLAIFAALLLLLGLLLWQGIRRGDAVRVGIPHSASAYGAAMLLQAPSAQYHCTLGSTPQVLAKSLKAGDLDAALLPAEIARELEDCQIRAVLGYAPLAVVSAHGDVDSLQALSGSVVTVEKALWGGAGERMLRTLLDAADVRCTLLAGSEGDPFVCTLDTAARQAAPIRFSLSRAWRDILDSIPPAGLCLTVRQDYLSRAGDNFSAFERALRSAVAYGGEKRKKTVAMAASAGLAVDADTADALYPYCDFLWLTGAEMKAALGAVGK